MNGMYVDGFVLPVPRKKLKHYQKLATLSAKVWREHGALEYVECVADDVQKGKVTSFPQSVKLKSGEVVVFAWAVYRSRAHRDRVMKKVMSDPRLMHLMSGDFDLPFDDMRMFWGGFKAFVSA
jgi:uncharacterized protein YbaA (DUF1428 family)